MSKLFQKFTKDKTEKEFVADAKPVDEKIESENNKHAKMTEDEHDIETVVENKNAKKAKRDERDKKIKAQMEEIEKDKKKKRWYKFFLLFSRRVISIINPDTYAGIIQRFENLLFVVFVDCIMLFTLVALSYIIYIAIWGYNGNWLEMLFKIGSCVVVAIICLVAQSNIPSPNQNKNESPVNNDNEE